ncbi:MAG: ABC transporter permease subunit [Bacilli bacterium]|nr:ABC transporter permease subunit [Bacilli bacterium]
MELVTIAKRNNPFRKFGVNFWKSKYLILMVIPAIIFYAIFSYIPMYGIVMAFKNYSPKLGIIGSPWCENPFENFKKVFDEPKFWLAFKNTLIIGSVKIIISFLGAVTVAVLLNELRMIKTKKTIQTIVTFPHFLSWVVVSGFVFSLFSYYGAVNTVREALGGSRVNFLTGKNFFFGLVFASDIWKEAGWGSIIYLATMAGIPQDQYEAADIDGATRLQKIWHITLPGIKPTAILLLIMSVGGVLSAGFDQILNLGNDLIREDVNIIDTYIYYHAIIGTDSAGVGTAIGLFKSVVSFILVVVVDRIAKACGERGIF